ncbi:hypothetical protein HYH02_002182 [Chlamydomonas schloesseri]|uniref:ABC transporter domain-containing protein n=1 Tax=Chlamydomonas schloesseri TaxID=2026947 RepID=A0A835WU92_9CHLO|nr:hypothetical protein HYH02_002182 [Chlamydomonas schloesseri]|eukprot:KAG2452836.1 hypothetical protein HYH02_002182 [Chlamydomonas schloesseri]
MCGRTVLGPIRLAILAVLVNAALGSQVQLVVSGGSRRAVLSAGTPCSSDGQCAAKQFCLHPGLNPGATGSCSSCWRCCLFPGVYGACPDSCNCVEGALCEARDGCSPGMFCSLADPWNLPNCQRCDTCTSNAYELGGSCSAACASGDMGGLRGLPHITAQQYLFLSFLANEVSQQGSYVPTLLLRDELSSWLQGQGVSGEQANQTVFRMLGPDNSAGFITAQDWMEAVTESTSLGLLCPAYDPALDPANQTRLVSAGCFCNASTSATNFMCPAGQRCSRAAYRGLETDMLREPTGQLLQAVCVSCLAGQFCGEGTYLQDESDLSSLDCPSGYYCPSPGVKRECPAGSFCTERSTSAITCNYEKLLITDPYKRLPLEPETVITRLRDKRDPLRGNFCPAQSTKPYEVCAAGHYCPNSSSQIICPKGHFCKAQSTVPWPCTILTSCPEGTHVPSLSWMALVIAGIVLLGIPLIYFSLNQLDKSVLVDGDDDAEKERDLHRSAAANRMTFRLLKSMKLSGNPLEEKYRGFGTVSPPINMEFDQLGLQIRPRGGQGEVKNVLSGVSGAFAPRRMNAILGPSGCGKTTFLNVLCGKITTGTLMGQVKINGDAMPVTRLRKIMGFVPQDDIVHEDLTVRENLNYSARMRLATDMDAQRRKHVVRDALEMLGLTAIQHYRVGTVEKRGISGGQRKRVNIGLELVAMPSLLFLDEPTSGLDATSSADILGSLVDMANLGMNIIMVIHQPRFNSFCMFDQVLLLGTGGRTVYQGSPYAAVLYFDKHLGFKFPDRENPSDILMDIIAGKVHNDKDPKLKNCNMLVEAWATSGAAWVDLTEQLNPTMVFKMSEVDPEVIEDWSQQFDEVDEEQRGALTASQLVTLFSDMGQDLTLEDAIVLIKKVNGRRPASAAAAARSHASSVTSAVDSTVEDPDSLVITKEQLLDALQGVRDQNVQEDRGMGGSSGGGAGDGKRNAAAKFYASQFVLPDLPEVQAYREELERQRNANNGGGAPAGGRVPQDSSSSGEGGGGRDTSQHHHNPYAGIGGADGFGTLRITGAETMLLPTASVGGSSAAPSRAPRQPEDSEHIDSDSYSPVFPPASPNQNGAMAAAVAAANAAAHAAANGGAGDTTEGEGEGEAAPVAESLAKRSRLSPNKAATGMCGDGADGNLTVRARALPPGMTGMNGSGTSVVIHATAAATVYDNERLDDAAAAAGADVLSSLAERRQQLKRQMHAEISAARSDSGAEEQEEQEAAGQRGTWPVSRSGRPVVGRGLAARNLAAMEALAQADVPLPSLPRRLEPQSSDSRSGRPRGGVASRSDRRSTAYTALSAYVGAYNELAEQELVAAAAAAEPARQSQGRTSGGLMGVASLASRAMAAARRASAKVVALNGTTAAVVDGDVWTGGVVSAAAAAALGGSPQRASVVAPAALCPLGVEGTAEDIDAAGYYGDGVDGDGPVAGAAAVLALPPLLQQLAVGPQRGPIAEATEDSPTRLAAELAAGTRSGSSGGGAPPGSASALPLAPGVPPPPWLQRRLQANGGAVLKGRSPLAPASLGADVSPRDGSDAESSGYQGPAPASGHESDSSAGGAGAASETGGGRMRVSYSGLASSGPHIRTARLANMTSATSVTSPNHRAYSNSGVVRLPPLVVDVSAGTATTVALGAENTDTNMAGGAESEGEPASGGNTLRHGSRSPGHSSYGDTPLATQHAASDAALQSPGRASNGGSNPALSRFADYRPLEGAPDNSPEHADTAGEMGGGGGAGGGGTNGSMDQQRTGGGGGRQRRASIGAIAGGVRKQRRQSWLQASFSSQGTAGDGGNGTPSAAINRKGPKKDTLYINSLLSNALVGAWAATQSVTAGRMNQSVARLLRPQLEGAAPSTGHASGTATPSRHGGASGGGANPNAVGGGRTGSVLGALFGTHRSQQSTTGGAGAAHGTHVFELDSKPHSSTGGMGLNQALQARLDMEEALASRKSQGFLPQLVLLLRRGAIKYVRSFWPMRVVDTILQLAAAFIIGLVHGTKWGLTSVPSNAVMCMVCLGVLSCVTHLRTFSQNRVLLWREAASGMSVLAYYLSQNIIDQIWVFTAPALSLGVYYYLTLPRMPFSEFYVVGLFVCWWASGMAYLVSAVLPPQNVLMAGVFISLIFGAFLHGLSPTVASARGTLLEGVLGLSYNRWAMEIVTINELKYYQNDMRNVIVMMARGIGLCGVDTLLEDDGSDGISASEAVSFLRIQYNFNMSYCTQYKSTAYGVLVALGLGFRVLAFIFLRFNTAKHH